jgi:hypothetical protein
MGRTITVGSPAEGAAAVTVRGVYGTETATLYGEQLSQLAQTLLKRIRPAAVTSTRTDGKQSIATGKAVVYKAQSEGEAQRNLDFAIANLESYLQWEATGRKEAKDKADLAEAKKRVEETRLKNGLALYNKVHATRHLTWNAVPYVSPAKREEWAKQAEQLNKLQRDSHPYSSNIFNGMINAASLYPTSFRL